MLRSPMRTSIAIGSGSLSQPHFRSIFSARSSYQLIGQRDTAPSSGFVTPGTPSQPAATADDAPCKRRLNHSRPSKSKPRATGPTESFDDRVETAGESVLLDHEGRREDQDVAVAAPAPDEDTALPQGTLCVHRELVIRLTLLHDLDPEEETAAAQVADACALAELALQPRQGVRAKPGCSLHQPFL